jgi:ADP-heptose:LPS heptosyltransferase
MAPTKIAVLRANAIGDFVVSLPALEALRHTYPEAEIVLLAKEWHAAFLAGRPGPIDRVVVIPPYPGVNVEAGIPENREELEAFFDRMAAERFDMAVQMHGGGRYSNPFVLRLGARLAAGSRTPDAAPLDRWVPYMRWQHEVLRYLEVVSLLGAAGPVLEPRLTVTRSDLDECCSAVPELSRPIALLHPGTTEPERRWPSEKFARVGDALAATGAQVLVSGDEEDGPIAEAVLSAMEAEAQNLAGRLGLGGLAGLLSRASVVVANDTGPLHLAQAVGAATVGLYSAFNLMTYGPLTRLRHRPAISWRIERPECNRHAAGLSCEWCASLISDITVEEVRSSALDLLQHPVPAVVQPAGGLRS